MTSAPPAARRAHRVEIRARSGRGRRCMPAAAARRARGRCSGATRQACRASLASACAWSGHGTGARRLTHHRWEQSPRVHAPDRGPERPACPDERCPSLRAALGVARQGMGERAGAGVGLVHQPSSAPLSKVTRVRPSGMSSVTSPGRKVREGTRVHARLAKERLEKEGEEASE